MQPIRAAPGLGVGAGWGQLCGFYRNIHSAKTQLSDLGKASAFSSASALAGTGEEGGSYGGAGQLPSWEGGRELDGCL